MSWDVEIHHVDIGGAGDCTIVVVRHNNAVARTVMIDGGKGNHADRIFDYVTNRLGIAQVDVVVVTHYDLDHFNGITAILENDNRHTLLSNARFYDPGCPPYTDQFWRYDRAVKEIQERNPLWDDDRVLREVKTTRTDYERYHYKTNQHNCARLTKDVNSFYLAAFAQDESSFYQPIVPFPPNGEYGDDRMPFSHPGFQGQWLPPHQLIGTDLLWNGGAPPGPYEPRLVCVAANMYVARPGGGVAFAPHKIRGARGDHSEVAYNGTLGSINPDNPRSLGMVLEFNNFRYYVAGDLERHQEDGSADEPYYVYPGVREYLNPTRDSSERFWCFKPSHHCADTATSRGFVDTLLPEVAFVSCSSRNQFFHPSPKAVASLQGFVEEPPGSRIILSRLEGLGKVEKTRIAPPEPPPGTHAAVTHYLTGYQWPRTEPPRSKAGARSVTAGVPATLAPGHVWLHVTEEQSQRSRAGYRHALLTALEAARRAHFGLGPPDPTLLQLADDGCKRGPLAAVGAVFGVSRDQLALIERVPAHVGDVTPTSSDLPREGVLRVAERALAEGNWSDAADRVEQAIRGGFRDAFVVAGWADEIERALADAIVGAMAGMGVEQFSDWFTTAPAKNMLLAAISGSSDYPFGGDHPWLQVRDPAALAAVTTVAAAGAGTDGSTAVAMGAALRAHSVQLAEAELPEFAAAFFACSLSPTLVTNYVTSTAQVAQAEPVAAACAGIAAALTTMVSITPTLVRSVVESAFDVIERPDLAAIFLQHTDGLGGAAMARFTVVCRDRTVDEDEDTVFLHYC